MVASGIDGTVHQSFNLMPLHKVDENVNNELVFCYLKSLADMVVLTLQGQLQIDEAYRNLSKSRLIQSSIKTHNVQKYEDTRENRVATLRTTKIVQDQRRRVSIP
jgi:hypothetical protein